MARKKMDSTPLDFPPAPVSTINELFCYEGEFFASSDFKPHKHEWGQLAYVTKGILSFNMAGRRFFALPEMAVWIPANLEHSTYNYKEIFCICFNVQGQLAALLPSEPCLIQISPIFRSIMDEVIERKLTIPKTMAEHRLLQVLVDELYKAKRMQAYLPTTTDSLLLDMTREMESNPGDNTSLGEWAKRLYVSERTLARNFQKHMGMSFVEWRHRLRFMHAVMLLDQCKPVGEVAYSVGYQSVSSFITMFKQFAGIPPERYRSGIRVKYKCNVE